MRLALLAIHGLCLFAVPALAQDAQGPNIDPLGAVAGGPVATLVLARALHDTAIERGDALAAIVAARLIAGIALTEVARDRRTEPEGAALDAVPSDAVDAARMLADARMLAGEDDLLQSLIDEAQVEATGADVIVAPTSRASVVAGARDIWTVPFFGGVTAEVGLIGDGESNLDLTVTDETGATVCAAAGVTDRAYCDFVPRWNGYFTLTVENRGEAPDGYLLVTN